MAYNPPTATTLVSHRIVPLALSGILMPYELALFTVVPLVQAVPVVQLSSRAPWAKDSAWNLEEAATHFWTLAATLI
jgi:hypothetical protein